MSRQTVFRLIWLLATVLSAPALLMLSSANDTSPAGTERLIQGVQIAVWLTPAMLLQWALMFIGWLRHGMAWWIALAAIPGIASWVLPGLIVG